MPAPSSQPPAAGRPARRLPLMLMAIALVAAVAGLIGYFLQAAKNRDDADERFAALSHRVTQGIVERLRRYEYGLRGARGVVAAANGAVSRESFARYAASRQVDREFPGARGFGVIYRVSPDQEAAFVQARRAGDVPDFAIRAMAPHAGDRFVITYVEPLPRNREAIGLDIASEPARREAALRAAETSEATLTAPVTLVQASVKKSGGLLLLLPIRRIGDAGAGELIGWSYAPLLIDDILRGLDAEEEHFALSLHDLGQPPPTEFFSTGKDRALATTLDAQHVDIPLYGRRWEARLQPTLAFVQSLHQASPWGEALKAALLGGVFAALLATGAQLGDRTRGQRLEQARRAAIVAGSDDAIIVQDLGGHITDWNDGAERLFGFPRDEAVGRTAAELLLPQALVEEDAELRATIAAGGRVRVFETVRRARDGSDIPVSITASPIYDDEGVVVGSAKILRDVREAKAAEQRMRELNASLEDQVRERTALLDAAMQEARDANQAKSRFLANVSHEIRTPMNAVIGLSHMLERTRLDADQAGMLARIRTAGKALMSLLNDVLDLSKIEAGEMQLEAVPFDFDEVIDEVASLAGVSAEQSGVEFAVVREGRTPGLLVGDSTRLTQILLNLLSNAIKFAPRGRVTLEVRTPESGDATRQPVTVRVSDTGIGMSDDVQRRLFQPFMQADASTTRKFGGTGLGLSIVRQLVGLLGGDIRLTSAPGQGSSFQVELVFAVAAQQPLPAAAAAEGPRPAPGDTPLAGLQVLVVDDNPLNREVADRLLRSEGATVFLACDGRQAVDLMTADDGRFHVVLMDVQMPGMDGLEATRLIRALSGRAAPPIVGLTAGVSPEERRLALSAGMDAVVGKPFDPPTLVARISQLVGRRAPPVAPPAPAAAADDWPALPGLDMPRAWRQLKGDRELFDRLLRSLCELAAAARQLQAPPDDDEAWTAQARLMHDLKGMAGTLGGAALHDAAGRAEQSLRARRWHDAAAALRDLADAAAPLTQAVARAAPRAPAAAPAVQHALSHPLQGLAALVQQLQGHDLAALATCRGLVAALATELGDSTTQHLVDLVQQLDFEAAVPLLAPLAAAPPQAHA